MKSACNYKKGIVVILFLTEIVCAHDTFLNSVFDKSQKTSFYAGVRTCRYSAYKNQPSAFFDRYDYGYQCDNAQQKPGITGDIFSFLHSDYVSELQQHPDYEHIITNYHAAIHKQSFIKRAFYSIFNSDRIHSERIVCKLFKNIQQKKRKKTEQIKNECILLSDAFVKQLQLNPLVLHPHIKKRIAAAEQSIAQVNKAPLKIHFTNEFLRIRSQSVLFKQDNPAIVNTVNEVASLGCAAVQKEQFLTAGALADFCWQVLDGVQAMGEGVALAAHNTVHSVLHPIQTAHDMVSGVITIADAIVRACGLVGECGYLYVTDEDRYYVRRDELIENLIHIQDQLSSIPPRELLKHATAFAAEGLLFHALVSAACQVTKELLPVARTALELLKNEEYIAIIGGSEVAVIPVSVNSVTSPSSPVKLSEPVLKYTCYLEHTYNPYVDMQSIKEIFSEIKIVNPIELLEGNTISIDYEHIFALQTKVRTSQTGVITKKYSIHHDYQNYFENSAIMPLVNKSVCQKTGYYKGGIFIQGMQKPKENTFFPAHWEIEQVRDAITQALNDYSRKIKSCIRTEDIEIIGKTNEDIFIKMVINNKGTMTTAFPSFEDNKGLLW